MNETTFSYAINTVSVFLAEQASADSYGISCTRDGVLVRRVHDVSPDRAFVQRIVDKCNAGQLHPVHLLDVIEDELP